MPERTFTAVEQEGIVLNAVWDMIDGMVNYAIFVKGDAVKDVTLYFHSPTHSAQFNILLADFLSRPNAQSFGLPPAPNDGRPTDRTYLFYLRRVCDAPQLNTNSEAIRKPLEALATWLEGNTFVKGVWLPSIEVEVDMRVARITFFKICGDIAKHNFARLSINVKRIREILATHGHVINEGQGYLVLKEFYEWFHTNIFVMHSSAIAEYLNNLRWGIYRYLQPEFMRSYERVEPEPMYRYTYPANCVHPLGQAMYWDLMNMVRSRPYFREFTASEFTKGDHDP